MIWPGKIAHQALLEGACWFAVAFGFALSMPPATAQQPPALMIPGNAAVTGFSGALPPVQIAPGIDPVAQTVIDLNGPSLRIVDLHHMDGPPMAQLVGAPKPLTVNAALIGQVFGVAIDDGTPANIYAAATSAYGLPITAPGPDGRSQHLRIGAPNATFMPGLWGPQGGPGSIWKIDGATGKVTLFATVTQNGRSNSGAALGGLAYDPDSKSLFVSDRETGFIERFALDGRDLGSYDHGMTGRTSQGLPTLPWDEQPGINITSPAFDSTRPASWNYAAPERRIFGIAVYQHRLYYAVADSLQIWSVGLKPDGSFDNDPIIELVVPPGSGPTEISKITFDEQGRMFLAERPAPTGAPDFEALAVPAIGRVLRYAVIGAAAGRRIWQQQPNEYSIGFAGELRNGNGGVAIGYQYDRDGEIVESSCGGFLWATGEQLRNSPDPALAARLARSGPLNVDGLQGGGTWRIRREDEPPSQNYFIDYDDDFRDQAARGHLGDIAILRPCAGARRADSGGMLAAAPPGGAPPAPPGGNPPPKPPNNPPGACPPDQVRRASDDSCGGCARPNIQIGGKCCAPGDLTPGGACSNAGCPSGQTAIGPSNFCCSSNQVYTTAGGTQACCSGSVVNGQCGSSPPTPPICQPGSTNPQCCPGGYVSTGSSCCLASQATSTGVCCPIGQAPSGPDKSVCRILIPIPSGPQCCASGLIPTGSGECCAPANVTSTGICCPTAVDPKNRANCPAQIQMIPACAPGYTRMPDGSCCNDRYVGADGKSCRSVQPPPAPRLPVAPPECPTGDCGPRRHKPPERGPRRAPECAPGEIRLRNGACVERGPPPCPRGMVRTPRGFCVNGGLPPPPFGGPRPFRFGPPMGMPPGGRFGRPGMMR